jgi:hypothetical protein
VPFSAFVVSGQPYCVPAGISHGMFRMHLPKTLASEELDACFIGDGVFKRHFGHGFDVESFSFLP